MPRCVVALGLLLALAAPRLAAEETRRQYLSGRDKDRTVLWRFFCTSGANSGVWTNIPVPSHWDMKGFGTLTYEKDATNAWNERGLYEHDFTVPAGWAGKRVFLVFEGVMTDTSAKLNGESVGPAHQGGFYRFQYEVTRLARFGATNRLEVEVARRSADESVNRAERLGDYWVFAGIYRPVYLEAVPQSFIQRAAIDAKADGSFTMDVYTSSAPDADTIEARVTQLDGTPVGAPFSAPKSSIPLPGSGPPGSGLLGGRQPVSARTTLRTKIDSPARWTAETPNLYRVETRLKRGGEVVHTHRERFGFRTFEARAGDGLYLNGRRIILKGVNRHSSWPDSGRCLSEAVHRLDIETIKSMNANAVRASHYPPDKQFLDLCDELGLYVLNELAGWHNRYDTPVGSRLVEAMVTRDVNHPSILFWNNGNEGGSNPDLDKVFHRFDPQKRPVLHPWAVTAGINTAHYLMFTNAEVAARGEPMQYHIREDAEFVNPNLPRGLVYMPTEFLHGLYDGGAGAGLADYWSMMMSHSNCAGGFLWVFADEGIRRQDTGKLDTEGNYAPDGIVGPYREREGSFYAIKQLWSPIQVRREADGTFTVENHYNFTDANESRFLWETRQLRGGLGTNPVDRLIARREMAGPDLPPGGSARLEFPFPANWADGGANTLRLRVLGPCGRELRAFAWAAQTGQFGPDLPASGPPKFVESPEAIEISAPAPEGGLLRARISRRTGLLTEVWNGGRKFSFSGLRLAAGTSSLRSVEKTGGGLDARVTATFDGDLREIVWSVRDGQLVCQHRFSATGANDAIGVLFDYPERLVKRKRWLGDGPYRVWKNRLAGGVFGVWENDYNNTITGYRDWVYPEFKGFFANVRWLQLETTEGLITVTPGNIPFVQVLTPEFPPTNLAGYAYANAPKAGLGFLHAIPPIGSKFKPAGTTGPQGQPNIGRGEYSGTVRFHFGRLP